jgi:hypothetical protein
MNKQTALQWYIQQHDELAELSRNKTITISEILIRIKDIKKQALQMEREQIEKSYTSGREQWQKYEFAHSNYENDVEIPTPRKYYNETYGGQDE